MLAEIGKIEKGAKKVKLLEAGGTRGYIGKV